LQSVVDVVGEQPSAEVFVIGGTGIPFDGVGIGVRFDGTGVGVRFVPNVVVLAAMDTLCTITPLGVVDL